jgi:hypothetical protein
MEQFAELPMQPSLAQCPRKDPIFSASQEWTLSDF